MRAPVRLAFAIPFLAAGLTAQAQEDFPVLPTEIFACNFVGSSDTGDLADAFDEFNAWADEQGIDNLTIYVLTPNFYSEDTGFDVIGLNIWPDGAAFGSGNALMSNDPDSLASFDGVVDCAGHSMFALVGVKPPAQDVQTGGLFKFNNCTMKGNRSNDEGVAAISAVAQFYEKWSLDDAHAVLFNIAGLPSDTGFQFKWLTYYPSYRTFGALFDHIIGESAMQALGAMIDPVMDCDSSRIYSTTVMRMAAAE